jgi:renalase
MLSDLLVVGAGLAGLTLAYRMRQSQPDWMIEVIDKSTSVGGRLSCRRLVGDTFDHGAQSISLAPEDQYVVDFWKAQIPLTELVDGDQITYFSALGMTALAKSLGGTLDVKLRHKALSLERFDDHLVVKSDSHMDFLSRRVVLTCPLPQSLEILERSGIRYADHLKQRVYSKAIVIMIQSNQVSADFKNELLSMPHVIAGVYPQHSKRKLSQPCWTIEMAEIWSNMHFELSDAEIFESAVNVFREASPGLEIKSSSVKKWRFARPIYGYEDGYASPCKGIFLAGDAFGGTSASGALLSARQLAHVLSKSI